ncbi:unnamed protein product [Schistosoma rodhaini]|uniref:SUI1 domain-containing protein n=1 Tax=Schistosoma rodhaini TaxID=6188 RepID=A0AA85F529_9TREM|nr:unnamed protein product [Schistosoma rodhaini]
MSFQNLQTYEEGESNVEGIPEKFDKRKILKYCKKHFACNGTVVEHEEYGEVLQFQGYLFITSYSSIVH